VPEIAKEYIANENTIHLAEILKVYLGLNNYRSLETRRKQRI